MKHLIYWILLTALFLGFSCKKEDKDNTAPVITLLGDTSMTWPRDSVWVDPGFIATDDVDGDITDRVRVTGKPDVEIDGEYLVEYNVVDEAGNFAVEKVRKVSVMIY